MSTRLLIVLRTGDAAAPVSARRGEFFAWIEREIGAEWSGSIVEKDVRDMDRALPIPTTAAGFIITGSSSSVTERAPWMLRCEELVRTIVKAEIPLFGICFGHQMIAEALGGKVTRNPRGREVGTVTVKVRDGLTDVVLTGLPTSFRANATHVDTVEVLPPGAVAIAESHLEPHAVYVIGKTTKCVQFHPEFDGDIMRGYVEARSPLIAAEGLDPESIRAAAVDAPHGAEILRNFVRHVVRAA